MKKTWRRETERKRILNTFLPNLHSSTPRPFGLEIRESYSGPINVPTKPMVYVVLEGHLYLSPDQCVDEGNYSYVYNVE